MKFQLGFFLKLVAIPLLLLGMLAATSPFAMLNPEYVAGMQVENELVAIRNQIQTTAFEEGFDAKPFEESINGTLEKTREIIDRGRERQSAQPLQWFVIALSSILAVGFVITLLHSWRADVARLRPSPRDSADAET